MHQPTVPISTPSAWGKQQVTPNYTPIYMGDKPSISQTKSIISTRLSDKQFRTISSGNEIASPYTAKGITSFTAIHKEIVGQNSTIANIVQMNSSTGSSNSRPGVPSGNGETPPPTGQLLPVGDMLLPMLVIALGYIVVKLFRNRKTSQTI